MENSSELKLTQKWIKFIADGSVGHEIEASSTKGITVVKAHKGFILCDFTIHNGLLDQNGNWYVGDIATLVDTIGALAAYSFTSFHHITLDFTISYYSTAKLQEEIGVEAKAKGKKDGLTSLIVEVRKKENGELVALGKLWMVRRKERHQESKL
ncbi:hypothetical protein TanjilG_23911 [Lupinus angustifolius]|uniref:Acyl-coenzyme A thioesterase 13 n=1 Tax=Lupinus angustifolius TaxID=3871 RepID=A0A1J7GX09_LUPAN|nr:PREDICTED: uncharacterized protein LOC109357001 [Lupinus angustifolius]OIW04908.1 hypothetical protein TanjilG_23911 [Lupinus angustifolius]